VQNIVIPNLWIMSHLDACKRYFFCNLCIHHHLPHDGVNSCKWGHSQNARLGSVTLDLGHLYLGLPPLWRVPLLKMPSNRTKCPSSWRVCVFLKCAPLLQRQRGFLLIIWPPKYTKILHVTWGVGCSQIRCSSLGFSDKVPSTYMVKFLANALQLHKPC